MDGKFIRERIKVKVKIESYRWSDKVIVVKLGSEEKKKVMRNKNKLKGKKILLKMISHAKSVKYEKE